MLADARGDSRPRDPPLDVVLQRLRSVGLNSYSFALHSRNTSRKAVAQELGISTQAVSKALARAQWAEEHAARPAAARLLQLILEVR